MKNIIWILLLLVSVSFAQNHNKHKNKHKKHFNKHNHHGNHHNHHVNKPNYNFWFGLALIDAVTGNNNRPSSNYYYHDYGWSDNTVMEMHFRYIPRRDEWVLQSKRRNVEATYFLDYGKPRIVATFENPMYDANIMHDYNIIIHRDGYWEYDCPESLRKYFTRKVKNNIQRWR